MAHGRSETIEELQGILAELAIGGDALEWGEHLEERLYDKCFCA
jgi:hypothetical protein